MALCNLILPYTSILVYGILLVLHSARGVALGLKVLAAYTLIVNFIPSNERSQFMSDFQAFAIGITFTYPFFDFTIDYFGWRIFIYILAIGSFISLILWYALPIKRPNNHRSRIRRDHRRDRDIEMNDHFGGGGGDDDDDDSSDDDDTNNRPWRLLKMFD